ncbi:MAG: MBL fold metallo-hydrolase [Acidimicrobiia bacterium]|nr:MBL fold metallo-hydrolase [Acidimicrobiia bacterium]
MSTRVVITGSGTPIPSAERAGPGVLIESDGVAIQFDAGRSTVQRLAGAGLWPTDLDGLCITHHHSDHVTGLADVVLTRWVMDRDEDCPPLPIAFPDGALTGFVQGLLDNWSDDLDVRTAHSGHPPHPGVDARPFPANGGRALMVGEVEVTGFPVCHEPVLPAVGYRVRTPDGVVAITGDTKLCDRLDPLCGGADVVVAEAMRFAPIEALPEHRRFILDYHIDTRLLGARAVEWGTKTLVLTHLIPEPMTAEEEAAYEVDIRSGGFEGELVVAEDLSETVLD